MKKLSYSSRTKRQKMKEEFDFFSDSTNFEIGNNLELEQNILLDNNVKMIDKSISQEVSQCP